MPDDVQFTAGQLHEQPLLFDVQDSICNHIYRASAASAASGHPSQFHVKHFGEFNHRHWALTGGTRMVASHKKLQRDDGFIHERLHRDG